ncbi:MAG: DNA primase [Lentisphaeria bacterium]
MISSEQIQLVKERTDIVELVSSYVLLKRAGNSHKGLCPFHSEKSPSFNVSASSQFYHCFGCGKSGNVVNFLMEIEGLNFLDAIHRLADRAGITLIEEKGGYDRTKAQVLKKGKERLLELMGHVSQWYSSQLFTREGVIAKNYLSERGIDDQTIRHFALGYSPEGWHSLINYALGMGYTRKELLDAGLIIIPEGKGIEQSYDRFRGRLMFPIWDESGNVIAFSARTLKNEDAKYINSPETSIFSKGRVLYGFHRAKSGFRRHNFAILCEGQLDVIACHRAGFDNAVAPQGTAFTEEQASLLKRFVDNVSVAFDSDGAGRKATERSFELLLKAGIEMSVISLPDGQDPSGVFENKGAEALVSFFQNKYNFFDYIIERFNTTDFTSDADRALAANAIIQKAILIDNPITRSFVIQKFSGLHISEALVRETLRSLQVTNRNKSTNSSQVSNSVQTFSREQKARVALLEIGLKNYLIACRFVQELPISVYTSDETGQILGELVGLTVQGEWSQASHRILELHRDKLNSEIARIIIGVHYDDFSEEQLTQMNKVADDCLGFLKLLDLEREEKELHRLFTNEQDSEKKRLVYQKMRDVIKLKEAYNASFTPRV